MKRYLILLMLLCQPVGTAWALDCNDWIGDNAKAFWKQATEAQVKACLEEGADPAVADSDGKYPEDYAWEYGRSKDILPLIAAASEIRKNQTRTMLKDLEDTKRLVEGYTNASEHDDKNEMSPRFDAVQDDLANLKRMVETIVDQRAQHDASATFPELDLMREELANIKGSIEALSDSISQRSEDTKPPDFSKIQKELEDIKRLFETAARSEPILTPEKSNDLPWLVALLSLIMALAMIGVVGWLFRRRSEANATVAPPSENEVGTSAGIEERLASMARNLERIAQSDRSHGSETQSSPDGNEVKDEVQSIKDMLMRFQSALDDKDKEIERLKEGYDMSILESHLKRIARLHIRVIQKAEDDPANKFLRNIGLMIEDSLEESGVTLEHPKKGGDAKEIWDRVEFVGHTSTPDPSLGRGQISEVISPAYIFSSGSVLVRAAVKIYEPDDGTRED